MLLLICWFKGVEITWDWKRSRLYGEAFVELMYFDLLSPEVLERSSVLKETLRGEKEALMSMNYYFMMFFFYEIITRIWNRLFLMEDVFLIMMQIVAGVAISCLFSSFRRAFLANQSARFYSAFTAFGCKRVWLLKKYIIGLRKTRQKPMGWLMKRKRDRIFIQKRIF